MCLLVYVLNSFNENSDSATERHNAQALHCAGVRGSAMDISGEVQVG